MPAKKRIVREDHFIDALDPGIRLHVREKRLHGLGRTGPESTLLFVHGQSVPAPAAFDLPLRGYSWMDFAAECGFRVFALTLRGYGLSSRLPEQSEPPTKSLPLVRGRIAVRDIEAAVAFVRKRAKVPRLNLLGYSFGTTTTAAFTAGHQNLVRRLVLYAPFYAYDNPERAALHEDPKRPGRLRPDFGGWRWVTEKDQHERWDGSIPRGQLNKWRDERAFKKFWSEQLRYDPEGRRRRPPGVRVPNGAMADSYDRSRNKPLYDASKITCPVLLIRGDHDRSSRDFEAYGLYRALTNSKGKRYTVLGQATHFAQYEWCRDALRKECQLFLEG